MRPQFFIFLLFFYSLHTLKAQVAPGGVGDLSGESHLQLWLKAEDLKADISDGETVLQWFDKSGAGNHVFASPVSPPIFYHDVSNGYAGVHFSGNTFMQTNGVSAGFSNPESTIFVVKSGVFSGTSVSISEYGWVDEFLLFDYKQYHHNSSGNFTVIGHQCLQNIPNNEIAMVCGVFGIQPNDMLYRVNGLSSNQEMSWTSPNIQPYQTVDRLVTIGQRDQFVSAEYLNGNLLEVIIYNNKLSEDEIQKVEEYLQCKYEIASLSCSQSDDLDCTVSVEEPEVTPSDYLIYPNPTQRILWVETAAIQPVEFRIYDYSGRFILGGKLEFPKSPLDISTFSPGTYILELNNGKTNHVKPFVKY